MKTMVIALHLNPDRKEPGGVDGNFAYMVR